MDGLAARLLAWRKYLPLVALLPVLLHLGVLFRIFALRLTYPMDAEWMEGGELYHAWRWLHGLGVYGAPGQGFVPYGYPPFHFVLLAAVGKVLGLDYGVGRALSILCFLVAAAVLFREGWRALGGKPCGLALGGLAVGLAAAAFPVTGGWYDLIRNDTLALALPVLAAGLVGDGRIGVRRTLVVAALLVAAVYTKQTGILFALWIGLYLTIRSWRRGLLLAGAGTGLGLCILGLAQWATGGWFWRWMTLMSRHPIFPDRLGRGVGMVLEFAPYLATVPVLFAVLVWKRWLSPRGALWTGMLLASLPASLLPHIKEGGFLNNLMPVVFLAGACTLLLGADLVNGLRHERPRAARAALVGLLVAAAGWLVVKRYDPAPFVVTAQRRQQAVALNELVRGLDGGVLFPSHPFLPARNGVNVPQAHCMAYLDADRAGLHMNIFDAIAASPARWLLWNVYAVPPGQPIGPYFLERRLEPSTTMIGEPGLTDALYRRR